MKVRVRYTDCCGCSSGDEDSANCYRGCPGYQEVVREETLTVSPRGMESLKKNKDHFEVLEVIEEREELVACAVCGASRPPDAPCACGFF